MRLLQVEADSLIHRRDDMADFKNTSDIEIKIPIQKVPMPGPLTRGKRRKVDFQKAPTTPSISPLGAATKDRVQMPHMPAPPGGANMSTKLSEYVCATYERQAKAAGIKLREGWREDVLKRAALSEEEPVFEAVGEGAEAFKSVGRGNKRKGLLTLMNLMKPHVHTDGGLKLSANRYDILFTLPKEKRAQLIDPVTAAIGFPAALGIGGRLAGRALGHIAAHGAMGARAGRVGAPKKTIAALGKLMAPEAGRKGARIGTIAGLLAGLPLGLAAYNKLREEEMKTGAWNPVLGALRKTNLGLLPSKRRARKAALAAMAGSTVQNLPELMLASLIGGAGGLALHRATQLES